MTNVLIVAAVALGAIGLYTVAKPGYTRSYYKAPAYAVNNTARVNTRAFFDGQDRASY